jgi:hypothetical protein
MFKHIVSLLWFDHNFWGAQATFILEPGNTPSNRGIPDVTGKYTRAGQGHWPGTDWTKAGAMD